MQQTPINKIKTPNHCKLQARQDGKTSWRDWRLAWLLGTDQIQQAFLREREEYFRLPKFEFVLIDRK
jgi:hypothetical protein